MPETGNNPDLHSLSIRISTDGFSFCTNNENKELHFTKMDSDFNRCKAICLCEPSLQEDYSKTTILYNGIFVTLVPSMIIDSNNLESILLFNFPEVSSDKFDYISNAIIGYDITCVFAIQKELHKFLYNNFPACKIMHANSLSLQRALKDSKRQGEKLVWADVSKSEAYIILAEEGKLKFANRFELTGDKDILYYCGSVFEQFALSQHNDKLYISGDIKCIETLQNYFANCIYKETNICV
ncbi:MAG: DUF3822 family protein [Bacteroidia bacterium]|nr:DUF3822 family protein [Bacteroidia bacterium]